MAYSVLIKNGTVLDGNSKNSPRKADVGISGNFIKDIGDLSGSDGEVVIDAEGQYVTPGFIDLTSHSDTYGTIFTIPSQESLLRQGVTTILLGNYGESLAPIVKKESLNDLGRWSSAYTTNTDWNSVSEYHSVLEELKLGVNVATLIGQQTLKRASTNQEQGALLLEAAMIDGAWGVSSNFSFLEWSIKEHACTSEFLSIVKKFDGVYKVHLQDEGKNLLPATASVLDLVRTSGVTAVISHFKAIGKSSWPYFQKAIKMIELAKKDGMEIYFDFFPYLRTGSMLLNLLPPWAKEGSEEIILKRLHDKTEAEKIIKEMKTETLHADRILVASVKNDKKIIGKTLDNISSQVSLSPEETILEILKINELSGTFFGKTVSSKNLLLAAKNKNSIVASDGAGYDTDFTQTGDLVHPRSFGAYPRFFSIVAPSAGLTPESAVEKMTALPARVLGLKNRGNIAKNFIADIAVFDPRIFKSSSTYKNPFNYANGLNHLILKGEIVVSSDSPVLRKGVVLRKNINH